MPYVRMSLLKGKSPDDLRALSDNVHRALVERHWHGAAPDDSFSYISIQAVQDGRAVDWFEPVEMRP